MTRQLQGDRNHQLNYNDIHNDFPELPALGQIYHTLYSRLNIRVYNFFSLSINAHLIQHFFLTHRNVR